MFESNDGAWRIWGEQRWVSVYMAVRPLVLPRFYQGRLLTYITYLQPWDYAAYQYLRGKSGLSPSYGIGEPLILNASACHDGANRDARRDSVLYLRKERN